MTSKETIKDFVDIHGRLSRQGRHHLKPKGDVVNTYLEAEDRPPRIHHVRQYRPDAPGNQLVTHTLSLHDGRIIVEEMSISASGNHNKTELRGGVDTIHVVTILAMGTEALK